MTARYMIRAWLFPFLLGLRVHSFREQCRLLKLVGARAQSLQDVDISLAIVAVLALYCDIDD